MRCVVLSVTKLPILFIAAVISFSATAPVPKEVRVEIAFPSRVGTKWIYQEGNTEQVLVVSKREQGKDKLLLHICEIKDSAEKDYEKIELSKEGAFRIESIGIKVNPPVKMFPSICRAGDRWETRLSDRNKTIWTIGKTEQIKVPAGQFNAVPIVSDRVYGDGSHASYTRWYADKVGMIMSTDGESDPVVLKEFHLGRD